MDQSKYKIYSTSKEAWDAMYQALFLARKSIYWQLYIFTDDEVGARFFDLLENKVKEGVDIKIVVDSFGSFNISRKRLASLKNSGVDLLFFNTSQKRFRNLWKRFATRLHRKVLVVDEDVGFIGGVNIEKSMKNWMDIQVKIVGKAVHSLLRSFTKSCIMSGGEKDHVKHLLKYKFRVQNDIEDLEFVYDEAGSKKSKTRKLYSEALLRARERVILFSPYYFPDKKFIKSLWAARKRGIKIDLLIPFRSDVRVAQYAAYTFFSLMKKIGVNIHFSDGMMHGKGVVVDEDWAMIGSSNIDKVSFYDNYEANVKLSEGNAVKKIKQTVLNWIEKSTPFDAEGWKKRGNWQKTKEWIALKLYKMWFPKE